MTQLDMAMVPLNQAATFNYIKYNLYHVDYTALYSVRIVIEIE